MIRPVTCSPEALGSSAGARRLGVPCRPLPSTQAVPQGPTSNAGDGGEERAGVGGPHMGDADLPWGIDAEGPKRVDGTLASPLYSIRPGCAKGVLSLRAVSLRASEAGGRLQVFAMVRRDDSRPPERHRPSLRRAGRPWLVDGIAAGRGCDGGDRAARARRGQGTGVENRDRCRCRPGDRRDHAAGGGVACLIGGRTTNGAADGGGGLGWLARFEPACHLEAAGTTTVLRIAHAGLPGRGTLPSIGRGGGREEGPTLTSRTADADSGGLGPVVEGGAVGGRPRPAAGAVAAPRVEVRDLFYATPARLKFPEELSGRSVMPVVETSFAGSPWPIRRSASTVADDGPDADQGRRRPGRPPGRPARPAGRRPWP